MPAPVRRAFLEGIVVEALNTAVDVVAVFAAERLLASNALRATRACLMTQISGVTMLGLGAYLELAKRQA